MSNIEETLGGLRIIKAFNAEGKCAGASTGRMMCFPDIEQDSAASVAGTSYERVSGYGCDSNRVVVWRYADTFWGQSDNCAGVHILYGDIFTV